MSHRNQIIGSLLLLAMGIQSVSRVSAQAPFDPPANYYNSATSTGSALKSQLHNIIDNHTQFSYDSLRSLLQITDADPNNPDNIILVYDRASVDLSNIGGSIPGWDSAATWNREHTWPRSRGVESSGPDNSDMHQLRPSRTQINSDRGSLHFGGAYGAQSFGTVFDGGSTFWYPGDADAGMIARQQMYVAVRYDGSDGSTEDLELANGTPGGNRLGNLSRMLEWHFEAPPDEFELNRNQIVFGFQNNRNPFIDRPEYAWSVFVDQNNDSRITISGGTSDSNGGSIRNIDLGKVFVGSSVATTSNVTINKAGSDGTYFEVTTSGNATSNVEGRFNSFRTGGSDSTTIAVGLDGGTSVPGSLSGSVMIDNLDITGSGGAGRGANDNDDAINLSLTVVDHASPSFSTSASVQTLSHDFGTILQGNAASALFFDVANQALSGNSFFTADLDIDQIAATGDVSQLVTTLAATNATNAIEGGQSRQFLAAVDTSTVGTFSATYTITVSDEDIPGALTDTLTLDLFANVIAPTPGDYDLDGDVDPDDYTAWVSAFGSTTMLNADGNNNGVVDAADYVIWRDNTSSVVALSVPEPSASWMLLFGLLPLLRRK